jgi:hypothetical protein
MLEKFGDQRAATSSSSFEESQSVVKVALLPAFSEGWSRRATPLLRAISAALWSTIALIAVRLSRCVRGVAALAAAAGLTAAISEGAACGTDNF